MDDDYFDEDWSDDDDLADVIPCPHCGTEVHELADCCPVCGEFILDESHLLDRKPVWYLVLGMAGIIAVILVLTGLISLL
jgi:hypothetical protein